MPRIYILGPVGSGKTTLAKRLSKNLNVEYFELDSVIWEYNPNGDIKRSKEEIEKMFSSILLNKNWIIEDVGRSCFDRGFDDADTIIYLNISKHVLYKRIFYRWIKQNLKIEKTPYKADLKMLKQMYIWGKKEIENSKLNKLYQYKEKLVVLTEKDVKKYKYK